MGSTVGKKGKRKYHVGRKKTKQVVEPVAAEESKEPDQENVPSAQDLNESTMDSVHQQLDNLRREMRKMQEAMETDRITASEKIRPDSDHGSTQK